MNSMLGMFKTAADEMKLEEQEEKMFASQLQPILDKLDEIMEQNKVIAEGMVAIADIVKERLPGKKEETQKDDFGSDEQKFSKMLFQPKQPPRMPPTASPMQSPFPPPPNVPPPGSMPPPMQSPFPPLGNIPPNMPPLGNPPPLDMNMPPPLDMPPGMDTPPSPKKKGFFSKK
jgi:hypothetical protein